MSSTVQPTAPRHPDLQNIRTGYMTGVGLAGGAATVGAVIGAAKIAYTAYTTISTAKAGAIIGAAAGGPAGAVIGGTTGAVIGVARGVFLA